VSDELVELMRHVVQSMPARPAPMNKSEWREGVIGWEVRGVHGIGQVAIIARRTRTNERRLFTVCTKNNVLVEEEEGTADIDAWTLDDEDDLYDTREQALLQKRWNMIELAQTMIETALNNQEHANG